MAVKIILKNSSVEFKNAAGNQLEFGELALNYNESGPYLQCKDADGEVINLGGIYLSDSATADAPGDPLPGRMWLRKDTLFIWDGANWVEIGGSGGDNSGSGGLALTIIGGDGIEASTIGGVVTITADINESRGLDIVGDQIAVKLGAGLEFDADGKIKLSDGAGGTVNDGVLTIKDADGTILGTFSANQATDDTIFLPAGFSGDYDDLINKPAEVVVQGDEGITVTKAASTYTVKADANTSRGIEINADKIAARLGAGLSFDAQGKIQADSDGLSYKGSCDVTSTNIISGASDGDMYANTGDGNFSAQWDAITSNADVTTVASAGDLMIYNGSAFDHIPGSSSAPGTDLGLANRDASTLDVTSSTGGDVTIPAATTSDAGLMTAADKTAVDSALQPGDDISELNNDAGYITDAGVTKLIAGDNVTLNPTTGVGEVEITVADSTGATNLGIDNRDATDLDVTSDTGADATIPAATTTLAGLMTAADKSKLDSQPDPGDIVSPDDIGDGKLTISDADGNNLGEFTANQAGDTPITLPAGFSGDYNDLINKPDIGDGKITIVDADGGAVGEFTVNQDGDTEITLPEIPVPEDQIHIGDTYPGTPTAGDLWVNTGECPPVLQIYNDCEDPGNPIWTPIGGAEQPPALPLLVGKGNITPKIDLEEGDTLTGTASVTNAVNPVETHVWELDGSEAQRGSNATYVAEVGTGPLPQGGYR